MRWFPFESILCLQVEWVVEEIISSWSLGRNCSAMELFKPICGAPLHRRYSLAVLSIHSFQYSNLSFPSDSLMTLSKSKGIFPRRRFLVIDPAV